MAKKRKDSIKKHFWLTRMSPVHDFRMILGEFRSEAAAKREQRTYGGGFDTRIVKVK